MQQLEPYKIFFTLIVKLTKNQSVKTTQLIDTLDWVINGIAETGRVKQEVFELLNEASFIEQLNYSSLEVFDSFPAVSIKISVYFYGLCNSKLHDNQPTASADCTNNDDTNSTTNFIANLISFRSEVSKFNLIFNHARKIATKCKTLILYLDDERSKHLYFNVNASRNWYQAMTYCANHNSTLISVESEAEHQSLSAFVSENFSANQTFHVGAMCDSEKSFFWIASGAKINVNFASQTIPICLALDLNSSTRNSTFSIIDCKQPQGFICQKLMSRS